MNWIIERGNFGKRDERERERKEDVYKGAKIRDGEKVLSM